VIVVLRIVLRLLADLIALTAFAFRRRRAAAAEILVRIPMMVTGVSDLS
jgi:hypothetical protein